MEMMEVVWQYLGNKSVTIWANQQLTVWVLQFIFNLKSNSIKFVKEYIHFKFLMRWEWIEDWNKKQLNKNWNKFLREG